MDESVGLRKTPNWLINSFFKLFGQISSNFWVYLLNLLPSRSWSIFGAIDQNTTQIDSISAFGAIKAISGWFINSFFGRFHLFLRNLDGFVLNSPTMSPSAFCGAKRRILNQKSSVCEFGGVIKTFNWFLESFSTPLISLLSKFKLFSRNLLPMGSPFFGSQDKGCFALDRSANLRSFLLPVR
jgi:hypothetical protein